MKKIHSRWSATNMITNLAKQNRAKNIIQRSGHSFYPHEFDHFEAPEGSNEFDFSQLPQKPSGPDHE